MHPFPAIDFHNRNSSQLHQCKCFNQINCIIYTRCIRSLQLIFITEITKQNRTKIYIYIYIYIYIWHQLNHMTIRKQVEGKSQEYQKVYCFLPRTDINLLVANNGLFRAFFVLLLTFFSTTLWQFQTLLLAPTSHLAQWCTRHSPSSWA